VSDWKKFEHTIFETKRRCLTVEIHDFDWSKTLEFSWWKKVDGVLLKARIKIPMTIKTLVFFIKHKINPIVIWKTV
jgi:hypothetical protein